MTSLPARMLLGPIRLYQRYISPGLPATCRYYPTCSAYAVEALQEWGALRGSWLALRRLGRCQPWSRREHFDPVPIREPGGSAMSSTAGAAGLPAGGPPGHRDAVRAAAGPARSVEPLSFQDAFRASPPPDHGSRLA
jgi:putative membrane protein insertion efficiency factor